jgi:hypothetical protein
VLELLPLCQTCGDMAAALRAGVTERAMAAKRTAHLSFQQCKALNRAAKVMSAAGLTLMCRRRNQSTPRILLGWRPPKEADRCELHHIFRIDGAIPMLWR